jgi:hypothetical protein
LEVWLKCEALSSNPRTKKKNLFNEITAESFPNLGKEMDIQVQEIFRTPNRYNQKRKYPYHSSQNVKKYRTKKNTKTARQKCQASYKGKSIRMIEDLSTEPLKYRKAWSNVYQILKQNNCQPNLPYSAKSFKIEGEIQNFHDKHKLKQFMVTKPAMQRMLERIVYTKTEERYTKA